MLRTLAFVVVALAAACGHAPPELRLDPAHVQTVDLADGPEGPEARVTLDAEGAHQLAEVTTAHVGERLIVIVHGRNVMSPVIRDPITSGKLSITGKTPAETREIAEQLRQIQLQK